MSSAPPGSPAVNVRRRTARSRLRCTRLTAGACALARLFPDAIVLQPPIERAAAHAELLRRQADIAAMLREHLLDEDPFGILERLWRHVGRRPLRLQPEIARDDGGGSRVSHQDCPFDDVRKLPDVAGPR